MGVIPIPQSLQGGDKSIHRAAKWPSKTLTCPSVSIRNTLEATGGWRRWAGKKAACLPTELISAVWRGVLTEK